MSAYTTKTITRKEAEDMVRKVRAKRRADDVALLTDEQLDNELHEYVYSEEHREIVGFLYNYIIRNDYLAE